MRLQYYYHLLSQPCRALHILLKMSNVEFQDCPVDLGSKEHLTDEYKQNINRFQKVPCIIDGSFKLAESVAIIRYLSSKDKIAEYLYPKYFVEQARVNEFLEWQHMNLRASCGLYCLKMWMEPWVYGKKTSPENIAPIFEHMERNLDIVEDVWLEKTDFLIGNTMTVADIMAACEIEQIRMAHYDARIKYPKIRAWLKRVRANCNPHYDHVHHLVYKISGTAPKL